MHLWQNYIKQVTRPILRRARRNQKIRANGRLLMELGNTTLQLLFLQNNAAYHDIHQLPGTKYNYYQPFFSIWDKILRTHMPYTIVKRHEGGLEARLVKG
ncbi:hypothetical protein NC651_014052 [Populus alba x Populus x berolinensis]|nr:hypothetical protein NC651_014052 [Populus alba x Populus x berolinensis]